MPAAAPAATRLTVGAFSVTMIWDGTLDAGLTGILRLDPDEARRLVDAAARASGSNPAILPVRAFLIEGEGRRILVDVGSGTTKGPTMGHLPASLGALGLAAGDIDTVLLTHMHMDHLGGLLDDRQQVAFANADLVVHEAEAAYWMDTPVEKMKERARRSVPYQRAAILAYGRRAHRVGDGEVMAGISAELGAGHTPGHTCWRIVSGGHSMLIVGDTIHMAAVQLPRPDSAMIYDIDADGAVASRQRVLAQAAEQGTLLAGHHLPGTGFGYIRADGAGYRLEAVG